jgi:hypothetical protein
MDDLGMVMETTGGYRVPLATWNDLANYLSMQRVGLARELTDKLTMLRSMEPEYQAWRADRERARRQWMVETEDTIRPKPTREPK